MSLVHNTDPYHSQSFVPINKRIIILFKRDIKEESLDGNIQIIEMNTQNFIEFDYVYTRRRLEIVPKHRLKGEEKYLVSIRGGDDGILDILDYVSDGDYRFTFTTKKSTLIEKPVILSPINESKYEVFPKILIKTKMHDELDYYVAQISRTKSFNKILWEHKIRNIYSDSVEVVPELKSPSERFYIRVVGVDTNNSETVYSDYIQIYVREKEEEIIIELPPEPELPDKPSSSDVQSPQEKQEFLNPVENEKIYLLFGQEILPESINENTVYIQEEEI